MYDAPMNIHICHKKFSFICYTYSIIHKSQDNFACEKAPVQIIQV